MLRHTEARIGFALEHMLRDPHFSEHVVFGGQKVLQSCSSGRLWVYRPRDKQML
jgi:hypothetical protein